MTTQQTLFPMIEAYNQLKDYITDDNLKIRVVDTLGMILIHFEPANEDVYDEYVWEQADLHYDDVREWFSEYYPTLRVQLTERDSDWFILSVSEQ